MKKLAWLEMKSLARRPACIIFLGVFGSLFYFVGVPNIDPAFLRRYSDFYLESRAVVSLGEWGRLVLLFCSTYGAAFFAMLVSVLSVGSFWPEITHREPMWSTPRGMTLRTSGAKLLAVGAFVCSLIILSSVMTFFNPSNREAFTPVALLYCPLYFALMWVQAIVWAAISAFLLCATTSRWATVTIVTAIALLGTGAGQWFLEHFQQVPFAMLLYKSYLSWNFMGPFAPLGLVPTILALHALSLFGLAVAFFAGKMLVGKRFLEWQETRLPSIWAALGLGIIVLLGAGAGVIYETRFWKAPFEFREICYAMAPETAHLFESPDPRLTRPYIWTKDGAVIFYPAKHAMVRLPAFSPLPTWVKELARGKVVRRYEVVRAFLGRCALVLIHPPNTPYPAELEGAMRSFMLRINPLLERAAIWLDASEIIIAPPGAGVGRFESVPSGLLISIDALTGQFTRLLPHSVAHTLSNALARDKSIRTYLTMYFVTSVDMREVEVALEWFHDRAEAKTPELKFFAGMVLHPLSWKPEEAAQVLHHWQRGEELGHENYIRTLLEGGN